eukprot:ctg_323.g137
MSDIGECPGRERERECQVSSITVARLGLSLDASRHRNRLTHPHTHLHSPSFGVRFRGRHRARRRPATGAFTVAELAVVTCGGGGGEWEARMSADGGAGDSGGGFSLGRYVRALYTSSFRRKAITQLNAESIRSHPESSRVLTLLDLVFVGVAGTLGAGIFLLLGRAAREVAGPARCLCGRRVGLLRLRRLRRGGHGRRGVAESVEKCAAGHDHFAGGGDDGVCTGMRHCHRHGAVHGHFDVGAVRGGVSSGGQRAAGQTGVVGHGDRAAEHRNGVTGGAAAALHGHGARRLAAGDIL